MSITNKEAIEAIKSNYPPERYTRLREALDLSVTLLENENNQSEKLARYEKALKEILDEAAQECEGYETTIFTKAREALHVTAEEYWENN